MNFERFGMTSFADSGSAGGTVVPQRQGMFSFLRGKLNDLGARTATNKYGAAFENETDPAKRRQMMLGAVGEGLQSLGGGQQGPEPPPLVNPGMVSGGRSIADVLQMMRSRRQTEGGRGMRGLFG